MLELGMPQVELGMRAFGTADNAAIQGLKPGSVLALNGVAAMAEALHLEVYLGPPRDMGTVEHMMLDGTEFTRIKFHNAFLSAGAGATHGEAIIVDDLAFGRYWLKRPDVSPTQAGLARVADDSMLPTLSPNDMLRINTRHKEPPIRARGDKDKRRSSIYAFVQDGEARVKHIERFEPDPLILFSDNPDCAPEALTGARTTARHVIGKVVWWRHTNRE
ncbi:MAG: S24 family peptidase [Cypionkella sp.]